MVGELHLRGWRRLIGFGILGLLTGGAGAASGQVIPLENRPFDELVLRPRAQGIVPIFDGWYRNEDGSSDLCFGYYSLNTEEAVDIPLGPANVSSRQSSTAGSRPISIRFRRRRIGGTTASSR